MAFYIFYVFLVVLQCFVMGQIPYAYPGQYNPSANSDMFQQQPQQEQQQQQQLPMHQQQQQHQMQQQQIPIHQQQQQQMPMHQQQQLPMHQQQQLPMHQQQQIPVHQQQQQQQQPQILPQQQQYYQGNMQDPSIQSGQGIQLPPHVNQFQQPMNDQMGAQLPSPPMGSSERYLVGNLSQPFSFQVAPPSVKVSYLGLNGYSLFITGVGFSVGSKFNYDEQNNRLSILSLDSTTVGYYSAVDAHWQTFVNIISAINVSSLEIRNSHTSEDNNGSALVSCSVSIIRSTFKLAKPAPSSMNLAIQQQPPLPSLPLKPSSTIDDIENLPRLDLLISTRIPSSTLPNNKLYNDTLNEQILTRTISTQRPLTRADHNGTIQCQVESNNNVDIYLIKTVPIDIEYGPNLETGAVSIVNLENEALRMISMECQVEANPSPSYVWYEMLNNLSSGVMPYYGQQNPYGQQNSYGQQNTFGQQNSYGQQYPLHPPPNIPTAGLSVFGTTRQIQKVYQNPGRYALQCHAQSRGKTIRQEFIIAVNPSSTDMKSSSGIGGGRGKSYKIPMIIGICVGSILLLLLIAILIAALVFMKRRKSNTNEKHLNSAQKPSNSKQIKSRRGLGNNLPSDYSKYKNEVLKGDSSTLNLVESVDSSTSQAPPIPIRPSPMTSTRSTDRQAPAPVSFSYQQAGILPGFRPPPKTRSYSPNQDDDDDEAVASVNAMPLTTNRSRTTTPFGSHKSLSESIQSLRSNHQSALSLPVKKRTGEPPPIPAPPLPKRDQRTPSPKAVNSKRTHEHHHYHNPAQLRAQQKRMGTNHDTSSDEDEFEQQQQQLNNPTEDSAFLPKKFTFRVNASPKTSSGYQPVDHHQQQQQQHGRRTITPPPPQKIAVHHPTALRPVEIPPSSKKNIKTTSSSNAIGYPEPTEV